MRSLKVSLIVRIVNGRRRCIISRLLIVVLMLKLRLSVRKIWPNGLITISTPLPLSVPPTPLPVSILSLRVLLFSPLRSIPDQLRPLKAEMFPVRVLIR